MIIHLETIIDIESGAILSDIIEEYDGPVMLCGGGSAPAPAPKTATEQALDQEQLEMLREQRASQKELEPFMLESMGYVRNPETGQIEKSTEMTPEKILLRKNLLMAGYDESGNILTEEQQLAGMTDTERLNYQTNKLNLQRQKDALEGKLEISPQLEEELSTEEAQAQEVLARKLGKDWALSTPGQNLLKTIKQKNALIREEARRGLITATQGVADSKSSQNSLQESNRMALGGAFSSTTDNKYNQMMGFSKAKTMGMDDSLSLSSKYASERANQQNLAAQNAATRAGTQNAAIAAGGTVVGAAAAAAAV